MNETKPFSFELHEDMLKLLAQEFDVQRVVDRFAEAIKGKDKKEIESIGQEIFGQYGKEWMKRSRQLGEEYSDRTYEVMLQAEEHTGTSIFPHVPQRFIEIAYLSTQPILELPVVESNRCRLVYRVPNCAMFSALKERGDEMASLSPCRYACLAACETLHQELNLDVDIWMEAATSKQGYCQFAVAIR